jgi:hypothetical protein
MSACAGVAEAGDGEHDGEVGDEQPASADALCGEPGEVFAEAFS